MRFEDIQKLEKYNEKIRFLEKYLRKQKIKLSVVSSKLEKKIRNHSLTTKNNIEDFMIAFNHVTKNHNPEIYQNYNSFDNMIKQNASEAFLYWYLATNLHTKESETYLNFGILNKPQEKIFNLEDLCIVIPTEKYIKFKLNDNYTKKEGEIRIQRQIIDFENSFTDNKSQVNMLRLDYFGLIVESRNIKNFLETNSNLSKNQVKDFYYSIQNALYE